MRKVLSIAVIAGFVAAASVTALAKPESVLEAVLKFYKGKKVRVLEIKREGKPGGNVATVIVLQGGKVKAYEFPPKKKMEEVKPLRTYDLEKVKALKMTILQAHNAVMKAPTLQSVRPVIRAITLHEMEDGALQYYVHVYLAVGAGAYRGAWAIDPKTGELSKDLVTGETSPMDEEWSEPLETDDKSKGALE